MALSSTTEVNVLWVLQRAKSTAGECLSAELMNSVGEDFLALWVRRNTSVNRMMFTILKDLSGFEMKLDNTYSL